MSVAWEFPAWPEFVYQHQYMAAYMTATKVIWFLSFSLKAATQLRYQFTTDGHSLQLSWVRSGAL